MPGHRSALITGITGQDGSFLAEMLLEKGCRVTGLIRPSADTLGSSEHLRGRLELVHGDLLDPASLTGAVAQVKPDELYHLASPSIVPESWDHPSRTLTAIAGSTATLLEAVREHSRHTRVFVAASGAMFGAAPESPQREETPCKPQSPYASAKLAAHQLVGQLREHDGVFACSGILYNHESERRPESFVSRRITRGAAAIKLGLADKLVLGDVTAVRDWSFAADVMHGAWLMLRQERPADYILSSGVPHTVAELAEIAFRRVGLDAQEHIRVDSGRRRSPEPVALVGNPSRARGELGWAPSLDFEQLIHRMVDADLRALQRSARPGELPSRQFS